MTARNCAAIKLLSSRSLRPCSRTGNATCCMWTVRRRRQRHCLKAHLDVVGGWRGDIDIPGCEIHILPRFVVRGPQGPVVTRERVLRSRVPPGSLALSSLEGGARHTLPKPSSKAETGGSVSIGPSAAVLRNGVRICSSLVEEPPVPVCRGMSGRPHRPSPSGLGGGSCGRAAGAAGVGRQCRCRCTP